MAGRVLPPTKLAVSSVVGTILMVAMTIVLATLLFLMISNAMGPPPVLKPLLIMTAGPATANATNASLNDTVIDVQSKTGQGDILLNNSQLEIFIDCACGPRLTGHNVTFEDVNRDGLAGGGDRIRIRGMTSQYHGAKVRVFYAGAPAGEVTLP